MISTSRLLRTVPFFLAGLCFSSAGLAQSSKVEDLGNLLADALAKSGTHVVAVADLTALDGTNSGQGHYLALLLSQMIAVNKNKLAVVEDYAFREFLSEQNLTTKELASPEKLARLASHVKLDAIVAGTVEETSQSYIVSVTARAVSDGSVLRKRTVSLKHTELLDSLNSVTPGSNDNPILRAGADGVGTPSCVYCPDPMYSNEARARKVSRARVVFSTVISAEGRIVSFQPLKVAGFGLDDEAYKTMKKWRLKPAAGKDGKPVAVIIPVEVTFRLSRN
jgi:TonB family protein